MAVLCGIPRSASVRADSEVVGRLRWDDEAFRTLLLRDRSFVAAHLWKILRTLVEKERALIDSLITAQHFARYCEVINRWQLDEASLTVDRVASAAIPTWTTGNLRKRSNWLRKSDVAWKLRINPLKDWIEYLKEKDVRLPVKASSFVSDL